MDALLVSEKRCDVMTVVSKLYLFRIVYRFTYRDPEQLYEILYLDNLRPQRCIRYTVLKPVNNDAGKNNKSQM